MDASEILPLLEDLESDRIERTVSRTDTDKFGQAICAFANDLPNHRKPGYLLVGVDDAGRVAGVEITDQLLLNLAAIRSDGNLLPPPAISVEKVDLPKGRVVVVRVEPSQDVPVRYKGRVWVRVGPRRAQANAEEERILSERRASYLAHTWDAQPCLDASLDDLVLDLFTLTYRRSAVSQEVIEENDRPLEQQLAALRFFDLKRNVPTNAGVLLFGKNPEHFFPGAYVQHVRFGGPSKADDPLRERRLSGDFLSILRGLVELARDLAEARPVESSGFQEELVYDYPPRTLRELFLNAVLHRAYEGSTSPVRIDQFEDRLEIWNPGGLYPSLAPEDFPDETAYRNPVLAEAARVLRFVERFGRGVLRARAALERNGSPAARFEVDRLSSFRVTVFRRP